MGRDGEWTRGEENGKRWGRGGGPGFSGWVALAVAVGAAAAGVSVGFFLIRGAPVASVTAGARPSASAPASGPALAPASGLASAPASGPASAGGGDSLPVQPGLSGNAARILLTGRVLAVSATSITIGGAGPSVTATVTGTTKVTGRAHAIGGVKVGDEVAAEITGTPSHLVTVTLQDPAS